MNTNFNNDIREQIIKDLLEKAKKVRLDRAKTYNNSFLDCYNEFGINYILGELFNCSKRLQILREKEDFNKIEEVIPDLLNWALLAGVCLKIDGDKFISKETEDLLKQSGKKGIIIGKKAREELLKVKVQLDVDTSKVDGITNIISSLNYLKKMNPQYYDYLKAILEHGEPRSLNKAKMLYNHNYEDNNGNIILISPKSKYVLFNEYKLYRKTYYLYNIEKIYYINREGQVYE